MPYHAYAGHQPRQPLQPFVYEPPALGDYDVEIQISHCGICHSDIHILDGDWGDNFPYVAGHEIIGTVTQCGTLVTHLQVGQRVGVGWQSGSCMTCEWCLRGETNVCRQMIATCQDRFGGFADFIRTDSRYAFPIPNSLSSENAAPLLCAGITVYSPLATFGVRASDRIGVIGIGGLGHLGIQFAHKMGCEVTAFSTSPDKEAEAKSFGASRFINSRDTDHLKSARNSLDFILCTVNVNLDWRTYLRLLRPNGQLCIVGAIPDEMMIPASALINGQKAIRGGSIGSRATMMAMLDFAARHHVVAQTEIMPMSQVNEALQKVRNNQARYRIVLVND